MKNVFFPNREVISMQVMNLTLVGTICVLFALDNRSGVDMTALVATTIFATTLIPARLLGIKWLKRFDASLLQIARNGKWLGIWTAIWFTLYTALALPVYYGTSFSPVQLVQRETVLLTASLFIFVVLLSLSNKWSYANVRWWKQINMFIWLAVPFLFTHFWLAANIFGGLNVFLAPCIILSLCVLAGVSGVIRTKRDYFAWWRVWLVVTGAGLSALVTWFYPAIL